LEGSSGDGGKTWTHTFSGVIRRNLITGRCSEHPPGAAHGGGELSIRVVESDYLEKVSESGGRQLGVSVWRR